MRRVIATYTLTNCGGLAIYEADGERVLVGYNDDEPKRLAVEYDDDGRAWFGWGGREIYLDECVRVGGAL